MTATLANNVRRPPQLAELIERLLSADLYIGFDRDFDEDEPDEHPLQIVRYRDEGEQQQLLANAFIALWKDAREPHETAGASAVSRATGAVADALARHDRDANGTPWGTVHAFKRLEAQVVILADGDGATHSRKTGFTSALPAPPSVVVALTSLEENAERASMPT
ncbi:hypothetical protein [Agrococcus baldri]|uniref:Uncharacterized protein n=1 Tax=Agrococcus baldri TaxID=153730 RepID=A0AA87RJK1_9MICO|nr:hypothetical protein [Agrococcus baldri]GEK81355.1 hypothetical protein ABA31_27060 [Agrococcus baldri]